MAAKALKLLDEAAGIIEVGDQRLLAGDGPAGSLPPDISLAEWRRLYVCVTKARAELRSEATPPSPASSSLSPGTTNELSTKDKLVVGEEIETLVDALVVAIHTAPLEGARAARSAVLAAFRKVGQDAALQWARAIRLNEENQTLAAALRGRGADAELLDWHEQREDVWFVPCVVEGSTGWVIRDVNDRFPSQVFASLREAYDAAREYAIDAARSSDAPHADAGKEERNA